ncbi:prohormone-2-like [Belonocnema kinseyi]|uniref:prohormone-2-like n=1 Tax=Belonocnema kinseyi TaxID=2817044 RepID=UPI00143D524C|nr:prohormone-2-like [Belonocnema kinseyi]
MFCGWFLLLTLDYFAMEAQTLPANQMEEVSKKDQAMRPKVKRTQELLMFGNQQNRQTENNAPSSLLSPAEKRMFSSSGFEDSKEAMEGEPFSHIKPPSNYLFEREIFPQNDQKYDYGKVLVNELGEVLNVPPYPYYNSEERRKRSDEIGTHSTTTTATSSPASLPATFSTPPPIVQANNKRNSLPFYQEPRYKRESEVDPEAMLELLQAWENEHRSRNWRNLANDEYDNVDVDSNLIGVEEEDPRTGIAWPEGPMYPPPRHYSIGVDSLAPSDIGIPRTHPASFYDQYGSQFAQQYDIGRPQYGSLQYGAIYPQHSYYPQEKRLMAYRKRSAQGYDSYGGRTGMLNMAQILAAPRGYPNYQHRFMY